VILYLDTSSLAKLYLDEAHSDLLRDWVEMLGVVATSLVAYPETLSAFSRRWNRGELTDEGMARACESFAGDWPAFILVPVNERRAGDLVLDHCLRGFDSVHLAAAWDLIDRFPSEDVVFSSFDAALLKAAHGSGFSILHPMVREGYVMEKTEFFWALDLGR
jgi:predicted nucleic acid-binding protein